MSSQAEGLPDFLKDAEAETEKSYREYEQRCEKVRKHDKPLLHFIFTINIQEGSFLNHESLEGWGKFINLHTMLFNKFFDCEILPTEEEHSRDKIIPEQFLLPHIIESGSFDFMRRCTYKGVTFDVWTKGTVFEIILDPTRKYSNLKLDEGDIFIKEFFSCWAGEALVKTLNLDNLVERRLGHARDKFHKDFYGYDSIYDGVLDLKFTSFIVYTYPKDTNFGELVKNSPRVSKVSESMWTENWAYLCDHAFNPPFYNFSVHILGHLSEDLPQETRDFLSILYKHMRYWSMIFTFENFMGILSFFSEGSFQSEIQVKKLDVIKSLLGKERDHQYISVLRKMLSDLHGFLYLGLGSTFRGLEEDASEQFTPRYIAGEYLHIFNDDQIEFTKRIIRRINKESIDELKKDLHSFWSDLETRIKKFIDDLQSQEKAFYQEYQLRLAEKTQELMLLSILIAIMIFLASKLPFNYIANKITSLWDFLMAILPPF
jgi:hypothetical protein